MAEINLKKEKRIVDRCAPKCMHNASTVQLAVRADRNDSCWLFVDGGRAVV